MAVIAAVTGAAGDIGDAIARRFLARGAKVAALDIDLPQLEARAAALQKPREYFSLEVDITKSKSVLACFAKLRSCVGQPTILVNNAGGISAHNLQTTTEQQWLHDIDLNLHGAWRCLKSVMSGFLGQKHGVIVNIASVNGIGIFGHPGYSVAKAGLIHLTKFAAVELGRHGVRSIAVCPGTVRTRAWAERQSSNPQIMEESLAWYPSRKISSPEDVASVVEFAALDAPHSFNGAVIHVDGGLTAGHDKVAAAFCGEAL